MPSLVRIRQWFARLMLVAVFAMLVGQVVAMPQANAVVANGMQSSLSPTSPCHHHGGPQGPLCCVAADCPMLTLSLPIVPSAGLPAELPRMAFQLAAMLSPDGMRAPPLIPPPRYRA